MTGFCWVVTGLKVCRFLLPETVKKCCKTPPAAQRPTGDASSVQIKHILRKSTSSWTVKILCSALFRLLSLVAYRSSLLYWHRWLFPLLFILFCIFFKIIFGKKARMVQHAAANTSTPRSSPTLLSWSKREEAWRSSCCCFIFPPLLAELSWAELSGLHISECGGGRVGVCPCALQWHPGPPFIQPLSNGLWTAKCTPIRGSQPPTPSSLHFPHPPSTKKDLLNKRERRVGPVVQSCCGPWTPEECWEISPL